MSKVAGSWFTPLAVTWMVVKSWTTPSDFAAAPVLGSTASTVAAQKAASSRNQGLIASPLLPCERRPSRPVGGTRRRAAIVEAARRGRRSLVPEVTLSGEDHRRAGLVDGGQDLLVADGAARLDDGRDARVQAHRRAVREGEERVRGQDRPLGSVSRTLNRDPGRFDPAHLPGADADRRPLPSDHDGVRLDVLDREPGEPQLRPLLG